MTTIERITNIILKNYKVGDSFTTYQVYVFCKHHLTNKSHTQIIPDGTINNVLNTLKKKGILINRVPNMGYFRDRNMVRSKRQKIWTRIK